MKQHVGEASISHDVLVVPEADVHWSGFTGLLRNKQAAQGRQECKVCGIRPKWWWLQTHGLHHGHFNEQVC